MKIKKMCLETRFKKERFTVTVDVWWEGVPEAEGRATEALDHSDTWRSCRRVSL